MSLNPAKISGVCGRLMCCLKYEHEAYAELQKVTPKQGSVVDTPEGRGKVITTQMLRGTCKVQLDDSPEHSLTEFQCTDCCVVKGACRNRQNAAAMAEERRRMEQEAAKQQKQQQADAEDAPEEAQESSPPRALHPRKARRVVAVVGADAAVISRRMRKMRAARSTHPHRSMHLPGRNDPQAAFVGKICKKSRPLPVRGRFFVRIGTNEIAIKM